VNIKQATRDYEAFLRASVAVVEADLDLKHQQMAASLFAFLRSTFYRWSALFREICPDLAAGPQLLAVGDLHVENFGTWRDGEGRLIWGVNDFDEAQVMPYAIDLVRLATSALLAVADAKLPLSPDDISDAILSGYQTHLDKGGRPFVLEEEHGWLRVLATGALRDPVAFQAKMNKLPDANPPKDVAKLLKHYLPKESQLHRFAARTAGLGSLGRPRYVALAELEGGAVIREAKTMLTSAWSWSLGDGKADPECKHIVNRAVRCADPCLAYDSGWVIRRLGPHCSRIEMADLPDRKDEAKLLKAMGAEIANIHLGDPDQIHAIKQDMASRKPHWLRNAAQAMLAATEKDWKEWRA